MKRSLRLLYVAYVPKSSPVAFPPVMPSSTYAGTRAFRATQAAAERADSDAADLGFFFLPQMDFEYASCGVSPFISAKQLDFQRNVLHSAAVRDLNRFTMGTELEGHSLDAVLRNTAFDVTRSAAHMAAAEHFNYSFFYKSFRPFGTAMSSSFHYTLQEVAGSKSRSSDSAAVTFEKRFRNIAMSLQGRNAWLYLVVTPQKTVELVPMNHGTCPVPQDLIPLLCLNLHESAYALDYSSAGTAGFDAYISNFLKAANWNYAMLNFDAAKVSDDSSA